MSRSQKPFTTPRRNDTKTFQITISPSSGLPWRVCLEWRRRSFRDFPDALAQYRNPRTKAAAEAGAFALVEYLKKKQEEGAGQRVRTEDVTVGTWIEKFTALETSPRTGINASRNRPYSPHTVDTYRGYYTAHIKGDPFTKLKMAEVEEEDAMEFVTRLSVKKLTGGRPMAGTRTFAGIIIFVRMAFREYQRKNRKWFNPLQYIDSPSINRGARDALPEDEMLRLFEPWVLESAMELAVCAAMFLSGLRRSEIFALKPECLDWHTPKITVKNAWQNFNRKTRVLGPPKGKKERSAPFDPVLQEAIKKLWEENGKHEFVFSYKDGTTPGPSWIKGRFRKWLDRAGIEPGGRKIVPHSSRHSLASLLEERGVSLRYIQELLGHSDLKTTKIYLHSTEKTIRDIGKKITEARQRKPEENIVEFKTS
ncbi:MAG: tyrosine-type recombinase/integrase [Treponema sp.]|jgi:integrase/recombinase XerD|nr:tyrosine-type recombinase/integrase [Treponema sp.]